MLLQITDNGAFQIVRYSPVRIHFEDRRIFQMQCEVSSGRFLSERIWFNPLIFTGRTLEAKIQRARGADATGN